MNMQIPPIDPMPLPDPRGAQPAGKTRAGTFARELDARLAETEAARSTGKKQAILLGTISADLPTVSHLLVRHPEYGAACWEIIHAANNRDKPYTRIPPGTEIYLDPSTREITWEGDFFREASGAPETPRAGDEKQVIGESIARAAAAHNLPEDLIAGVIRAESNFNAQAVSRAGAQGLMQLMPGTAREMNVKNPFDIRENIDGGTRYLKKMLELFGGNLRNALAAYNAGPETVRRFGGNVPYRETREYVERVLSFLE